MKLGQPDDNHFALRPRARAARRNKIIICAVAAILFVGIWVTSDFDAPAGSSGPTFAEMDGQKAILTEQFPTYAVLPRAPAVWAFNFDADVNVTPVQEVVNAVVGIDFDKPVLSFGNGDGFYAPQTQKEMSSRADTSQPIRILYGLPDLENLPGTYEDQRETALLVTLEPENVVYHYENGREWTQPLSFLEHIERRTEFECLIGDEIAMGITQLREPTKREAAQILQDFSSRGVRFNTRQGCVDKLATRGASYVVTDDNGDYTGYGDCISYSATAKPIHCEFRFFLPQNIVVTYQFPEAFLPRLREIDDFVRKQLYDATVLSASEHIRLPDA